MNRSDLDRAAETTRMEDEIKRLHAELEIKTADYVAEYGLRLVALAQRDNARAELEEAKTRIEELEIVIVAMQSGAHGFCGKCNGEVLIGYPCPNCPGDPGGR